MTATGEWKAQQDLQYEPEPTRPVADPPSETVHRGEAMNALPRIAAVAAVLLALGGCASPPRRPSQASSGYCVAGYGCYRVLASAAGYRASGIASWYGKHAVGRPTASGVPFDPGAMRIASKSLPFGTWVAIRNLRNGREAVAMVDDRGPFHAGRIIDATPAVARQLGFYLDGTAPVRVTAVPVSALSTAEQRAAREDERVAIEYTRRHPHRILAEAGHVAVRGVVDVTETGAKIGVGVVRGVLGLGLDVLDVL